MKIVTICMSPSNFHTDLLSTDQLHILFIVETSAITTNNSASCITCCRWMLFNNIKFINIYAFLMGNKSDKPPLVDGLCSSNSFRASNSNPRPFFIMRKKCTCSEYKILLWFYFFFFSGECANFECSSNWHEMMSKNRFQSPSSFSFLANSEPYWHTPKYCYLVQCR